MTAVKTRKPTQKTVDYILAKGTIIGAGAYREVYKTKYGKWVVKVNRNNSITLIGDNEHEYAAYLSLRSALRNKLPDNVRIPEMHMRGDHLLAEFIEGEHPDSWCGLAKYDDYKPYHSSSCKDKNNCWVNRLSGLRIKDIHRLNVIMTKDNILYLIDLGFGED